MRIRRLLKWDVQLYLAIGVSVLLNLIALLFQSRAVEMTLGARIDGLEKVTNAKLDAVYARFDAAREGLMRVNGVPRALSAARVER